MKLTVIGINRSNGSIRAEVRDEHGTVVVTFEGNAVAHAPGVTEGWTAEVLFEAPPAKKETPVVEEASPSRRSR